MPARKPEPAAGFSAVVSAPAFSLGIRCDASEIAEIEFLVPQAEIPPENALAKEAARQVRAYLRDPSLKFSLPLAAAGTPFQQAVWQGIAAIPRGKTLTYAELAATVGSGPRAVGNACGANPFPVVVPCHRVVSASGLGGFARHRGGFLLDVKRWLLSHEGI